MMPASNADLIEAYRNKHDLEPVLFSIKKIDGSRVDVDGTVTPLKLDLRQYCTPTDDQESTSHCAAYSAVQIVEAKYWRETGKLLQLDGAHVYAKAKEEDGIPNVSGTYPETTLKCALKLSKKFFDGSKYEVKKLYNDRTSKTIEALKRTIHKNGFLAGGFKITDEWFKLKRGNSLLSSSKGREQGGHCVTVVGYLKEGLIVQNSWGKNWGAMGFGRIAWDVVLNQLMYAAYLERK